MKEAVLKTVRENPDKTYREIAQLHGVPMAQVSVWAREAGIRRKAPRGEGRTRGFGKLWNVEQDSLENIIREKEAELAKLKQELAAQSIRFECEGEVVAVYGISPYASFKAHYKDWLRFLRRAGPAQLREVISNAYVGPKQ
jgi:transposase-like protein